ncbi:MAG: hypothetical protein CM15mP102_18890 [Flavobacteriales bacterium]|jgi:hypothetical protein|nr:DUF4296 domain-containing protein [Flavobacteriaceae bacterium]GIS01069.1 MAG: hypothetical protein CM15mP102_18890 [Flavobacteriales bacterium]|tara:strand:- start:422 stop:739 length:318 start_codon:yes stop_codon:yes gene_type:complete
MKKYLLVYIFMMGCSSNAPENLISEEKMESIIFDIMILNASSSYDLKIDNNMISDELIFRKHDIDSAQFYDSELYYSKNPRIQLNIYSNVKRRIQKSIDSLKNIK